MSRMIDMMEDVSLNLPWVNFSDKEFLLDQDLERLLLDVYSTVVSFYARTIRFLRNHKHGKDPCICAPLMLLVFLASSGCVMDHFHAIFFAGEHTESPV